MFEQMASSQDLVYHTDKIEALLQTLIEQNLYTFYATDAKMDDFVTEVRTMVEAAREWIIDYMSKTKSYFL
jgi:DNA replication factor Dna2.